MQVPMGNRVHHSQKGFMTWHTNISSPFSRTHKMVSMQGGDDQRIVHNPALRHGQNIIFVSGERQNVLQRTAAHRTSTSMSGYNALQYPATAHDSFNSIKSDSRKNTHKLSINICGPRQQEAELQLLEENQNNKFEQTEEPQMHVCCIEPLSALKALCSNNQPFPVSLINTSDIIPSATETLPTVINVQGKRSFQQFKDTRVPVIDLTEPKENQFEVLLERSYLGRAEYLSPREENVSEQPETTVRSEHKRDKAMQCDIPGGKRQKVVIMRDASTNCSLPPYHILLHSPYMLAQLKSTPIVRITRSNQITSSAIIERKPPNNVAHCQSPLKRSYSLRQSTVTSRRSLIHTRSGKLSSPNRASRRRAKAQTCHSQKTKKPTNEEKRKRRTASTSSRTLQVTKTDAKRSKGTEETLESKQKRTKSAEAPLKKTQKPKRLKGNRKIGKLARVKLENVFAPDTDRDTGFPDYFPGTTRGVVVPCNDSSSDEETF